MNISTFYLYSLLKKGKENSLILSELVRFQRNEMISDSVVKYILKKRDIPQKFYEQVYYGVTLYHEYENKKVLTIS